jgi:hypothetical protein
MPPDFSQITPLLTSALVVFVIYRRLRRTFGRQLLQPTRLYLRIGILSLVGVLLVPSALRGGAPLAAALCGLAIGGGLAAWAMSQTKFMLDGPRLYYVPHTYTGVIVSLLFLGRLAYRFAQVYSMQHGLSAAAAADSDPAAVFGASMVRKPLTLGIFYVVMAYYVGYYSLVLKRSKHVTRADLEASGESAAAENRQAPPPASP